MTERPRISERTWRDDDNMRAMLLCFMLRRAMYGRAMYGRSMYGLVMYGLVMYGLVMYGLVLGGLGCNAVAGLDALEFDPAAAGGATGTGGSSTGAGSPGGTVRFIDDELDGEFGEGTLLGLGWTGSAIALNANENGGELLSRVFDAEASAQWSSITIGARDPYGAALPDEGMEDGYPGGVDMQDNILLLHLDVEGDLDDGSSVMDLSPKAYVLGVSRPATADLRYTDGVFAEGVEFDDGGYLYVTITDDDPEGLGRLGTSDFTWSYWVNTTDACDRHNVHIGTEGVGTDRTHVWIGCVADFMNSCNTQPGRVGGAIRSNHGAADGSVFCGTKPIADGQWHHVVMVKQGHNDDGLLLVYVDGEVDLQETVSYLEDFNLPSGQRFSIGAFEAGIDPTWGIIDEVAIWRRALSADEIQTLYRRGAKLRVQARACADPGCTNAVFVGPDGSTQSFFVPSPQGPDVGLDLLEGTLGRYVQYRVLFEARSPAFSPELLRMELTGERR